MSKHHKADALAALGLPIVPLAGPGAPPAEVEAPPAPEAEAPVEAAPSPPPAPVESRTKVTFFVPAPVHERLREISFRRRVTQTEILSAAIDAYFEAHGLPERCKAGSP